MKNEKLDKLTRYFCDFGHVVLAELGAVLLALPFVVDIKDKEKENAMFVAAMVLLTYGVLGWVINKHKSKQKSKISDKTMCQMRDVIAQRKQMVKATMMNQK